jgi:multidrug resistance efflux pump
VVEAKPTQYDWGVPLFVGAIALVLWLSGGRYVSTDDSYIHAAKLVVSSDVSSLVSDVYVHEGQRVRKGEALFRVDPKQFQISVDNAKAQLAQTALNLRSMKEITGACSAMQPPKRRKSKWHREPITALLI